VRCFLLDEHLRGPLWVAILRHNRQGGLLLDAGRVGDPPDLPLASPDPTILLWAEREGRILLTEDVHTMPGPLAQHLQGGHHSPGVYCSLHPLGVAWPHADCTPRGPIPVLLLRRRWRRAAARPR
jgi:hypothetical protein